MSDSFTLIYKRASREELINVRRHLRSYFLSRLRGSDARLPKLMLDERSIILENWSKKDVEGAISQVNRSLGPGKKPIQPEINVYIVADSEIQLPTEKGNSYEAQNLPSVEDLLQSGRLVSSASTVTKYALLVTGDVLDALSGISPKLQFMIKSFLVDLTSKKWESWNTFTDGFQAWINENSDRYLFTRSFPGIGAFVWERLQTVDVLRTINYPVSAYDAPEVEGNLTRPHVIIYELREVEDGDSDILTFQGTIFKPKVGLNERSNYNPLDGKDELTYSDELYHLSPSSVTDVLSGIQSGLPLHLAEEQAKVLRAPSPILLSGEAGSGKTSVIVQWLVINHISYELARGEKEGPLSQLFVTYSDRLRDKAQLEFDRMLPKDYRTHKTVFRTYKQILEEIIARSGMSDRFPRENFVNLEKFLNQFGNKTSSEVDPLLLWDEIRSAIKGTSTGETGKFIDIQRYKLLNEKKGRAKTPTRLRDQYYSDALKYQLEIEGSSQWDVLDLVQACITQKEMLQKYDRIACDEVQDLAPIEIQLLLLMLNSQSLQGLFLTGDVAQVINPSGFTWSRLKGDLWETGNGAPIPEIITFNRNYRSTREIIDLVNGVLAVRNTILGDEVANLHQEALVSGDQNPVIVTEDPLKVLQNKNTNPGKRLILVKTRSQKSDLLEKLGDSALSHSVLTVEEAKGLEWEGVLLYNFFVPRHEYITKNDWLNIFDQQNRERIASQIEAGSINPYGITYEFNILHVGLTRSRKILAVYDHDPRTSISNIGSAASKHLKKCDTEAFELIWKTDPPKAEDWRGIGEKLLDRDSEQARKFLRMAAIQFQEDGDYLSAAYCFEEALTFDKAAECFLAIEDEPEEYRVLSRQALESEDYEEAGNFQLKRGDSLLKVGNTPAAREAFYEAQSLYENSMNYEKAVESATKRVELFSPLDHKERAKSYDKMAGYYRYMEQNDRAISMLDKAVSEAESSGLAITTVIEGDPTKVWIANKLSQKVELLLKLEKIGDAATTARIASGMWLSVASEYGKSTYDQRKYSDIGRDWLVRSIELLIKGGKLAAAGAARKELKDTIDLQVQDNWIDNAWRSFMSAYMTAQDYSEYVEAALELASIFVDRKQLSLATEVIRAGLKNSKEAGAENSYGNFLDRSVEVVFPIATVQFKSELLAQRGDWLESQGAFEDAFDDFKNLCRYTLEEGDKEKGIKAIERAKNCAIKFMRPLRIGRFLIVEVVNDYMRLANRHLEKLYTTQEASTYFVQDFSSAMKELDALIARRREEVKSFQQQESKADLAGVKLDLQNRKSIALSVLGWNLLSKYITILTSKKMQGEVEDSKLSELLEEVYFNFELANDTDSIKVVSTKYKRPKKQN